jgi:hypothetical protein
MTKIRILIFILTLIVVGSLGYIVTLYARGYRFDLKTFRFSPNGILVIKSDPNGASVYINGDLKTATDATLPLPPGIYDVEIRKEGFFSWQKRLTIEKEIVTSIATSLFRSVPSLSPITFLGCSNPITSTDQSKIAFEVLPSSVPNEPDKAGLWILETLNLPLGFTRDPRQITDGNLIGASWEFSPSGREILLTTKNGVFQLDTSTFTPQNKRVNVSSKKETILSQWDQEKSTKLAAQIKNLPPEMTDILTRKAQSISFSPDENMILYTASGSATIPDNLIKPLPGSSTQKQERTIKDGQTYVYDIKEDRNFLITESQVIIDNSPSPELKNLIIPTLRWFPTSKHLLFAEDGKVTIMDYDGTNRQVVYSGNYVAPNAFSFVNTGKILILTNLGADSTPPNLYSLTLK